jgi:tetratricopeptide (TPR) repeat protein
VSRSAKTNEPAPANSSATDGWRRDMPVVGFLVFAILLVFWPLTRAEFINYDDPDYVTANLHVLQGLSPQSVAWAFRSLFIYWQPLTWLSYMLDYEVYGLKASGFHLTNVLLHMANSLVLFLALRRLTGARWRSLFAATLFALHPLHVETVAWISERKGLLSTLFWFLALWAYARYAERPGLTRYLVVVVCFALGLMTKSMLVTLPCLLLLLDFWPLRRGRSSPTSGMNPPDENGRWDHRFPRKPVGVLLLEKVPLLALSAASSVLSVLAQKKADTMPTLAAFSVADRLANAVLGYAKYLAKTLWPVDLLVFYQRPIPWVPWQVAAAAVVVLAGCVAAAFLARRRPYVFVGWFWFVGTLVPVIGLLQAGDQAIADRYTYVPLIGLFVLVVWGAAEFARGNPLRKTVVAGLGVAAVLACVNLTARQAQRWQSTRTLFEHALRVDGDNAQVCAVVGSLRAGEGRYDEAVRLFEHALRITPTQSDAHVQWGLALEQQGKLDEAISHYAEAVRIKPGYAEAHLSLGLALIRQRRFDEAIQHCLQALRLNPESAAAHNNLALALQAQGRLDEAIAHYFEALRLNPELVETHSNLALALHTRGRLTEAIGHYTEALRRRPESAGVHLNLGGALMGVGRTDEAVEQYREALRLSPDLTDALDRLAWLRATSANPRNRDGIEALRLARHACALTGYKDPMALSTLAVAHAENAQFAEAVKATQDAIGLAVAAGHKDMADAFAVLLKEFQAGRAHREGQSGNQ